MKEGRLTDRQERKSQEIYRVLGIGKVVENSFMSKSGTQGKDLEGKII